VFGYVHGEKVTTKVADTDVWFKLSSGYSWAGNFTNPGVGTLKNLTPVVKVTTTKAPTTSKVTSTPAPVVSAPVTTTPAPEPVPAPPVIQDPFTTPVNVRVVETVPPAPKDNWLVSVLKAIGALFSGAKS
jgi:hypothetical protein